MSNGVRMAHYGQHPETCFACKLKSLNFGAMQPALHNAKDRWANDPVKNRMEELHGITIDTDAMNKRSVDLQKEGS